MKCFWEGFKAGVVLPFAIAEIAAFAANFANHLLYSCTAVGAAGKPLSRPF
jgi:hypothetical protein